VWHILLGLAVALVAIWVAMVVVLYVVARKEDDPTTLRDVVRLVPDVVRLIRGLAADPTFPEASDGVCRPCWSTWCCPSTSSPTSSPSWVTPTTRSWWPWHCALWSASPAPRR